MPKMEYICPWNEVWAKFSSEIDNFKRSWIFSRFGPLGQTSPRRLARPHPPRMTPPPPLLSSIKANPPATPSPSPFSPPPKKNPRRPQSFPCCLGKRKTSMAIAIWSLETAKETSNKKTPRSFPHFFACVGLFWHFVDRFRTFWAVCFWPFGPSVFALFRYSPKRPNQISNMSRSNRPTVSKKT